MENCATFAGFLDEAEKLQNTPGQTRSLYRTFLAFNDFAQYAGIPYADYARQRADFSAPELERGLNVYRNVTDLHYDNDELPGAADIRDGKALWISPVFPPTGVLIGAGLIRPDNSGGFTDVEPRWEDFDAVMAYADQVAGVFYPCEQTRFVDVMEKYLSGETSYANAAKAAQSQLNIYLSE